MQRMPGSRLQACGQVPGESVPGLGTGLISFGGGWMQDIRCLENAALAGDFRPGHLPPALRVASYGLAAIHSHFRSLRSHPTVLQGGDQMSIRCGMCLAFEIAQPPGGLSQGDRSIHKVPAHEPGHGLVIPNRMLKNTPSGLSAQPRVCQFRHKFFTSITLLITLNWEKRSIE